MRRRKKEKPKDNIVREYKPPRVIVDKLGEHFVQVKKEELRADPVYLYLTKSAAEMEMKLAEIDPSSNEARDIEFLISVRKKDIKKMEVALAIPEISYRNWFKIAKLYFH